MKINKIKENRNQWLHNYVLAELNEVNVACEIGVWRGEFSLQIINTLKPLSYYGVDPYELYEGYTDRPGLASGKQDFANQENLNQLYKQVNEKFINRNAHLYRMKSEDAAKKFKNDSMDFVYIDSYHSYDFVKKDIELWWPKIRKGGILAGHDFIEGSKYEKFGVIEAVTEFAKSIDSDIKITSDKFASWWFVK